MKTIEELRADLVEAEGYAMAVATWAAHAEVVNDEARSNAMAADKWATNAGVLDDEARSKVEAIKAEIDKREQAHENNCGTKRRVQ